jgi:transcription initiation factor TFIID TATA-box-binding protein
MGDSKIKIENVVASTALGVKIELERVAVALENVEYEPEQFPGLVYHLDEPKTAALIFGSGKIVCTGAKSIEEVKRAIQITVERMRSVDVNIPQNPVVEVQNIVASANLNAELNLDAIAIGLDGTEYEPEQFPGLVYRMTDPKVVVLLFGSGKMVCTGAKKAEDAEAAVDKVYEKLDELGLI